MEEHVESRPYPPSDSEQGADRKGLPLCPFRQRATIQCLNVRGLALASNKVKVKTLEESLEVENSVGIFLTETWLDESVTNAELQMNNYEIYLADRMSRARGGAAICLRKNLQCKQVFTYSNSVVESLIVKCKFLKCMFICVYRPPSTSIVSGNKL